MLGLGVGSNSGLAAESSVMPRGGGYSNEYSVYFDGTGDYFDTRDQTDSLFQSSFTIAFWAWPSDGRPAANQTFCGSSNSGGTDRIWLYLTTAGQLAFYHVSNGDLCLASSPVVFSDGSQSAWTHIALSVTKVIGGDTTYQFYVNGAAVTTSAILAISDTNHAGFSTNANFYIGGINLNGVLNSPIHAFMDEFAIFGSALSSTIAAAVYNSGTSFDLTAPFGADYTSAQANRLKLYYRFENSPDDLGSIGSDGAVAGDTIYTTLLTPP